MCSLLRDEMERREQRCNGMRKAGRAGKELQAVAAHRRCTKECGLQGPTGLEGEGKTRMQQGAVEKSGQILGIQGAWGKKRAGRRDFHGTDARRPRGFQQLGAGQIFFAK